jgi:type I restriction enzyme S subunit
MAEISKFWFKKPLGDVVEVISGYAFKSSEFVGRGIPVIKIKNIRVGFVDLSDADCVDEKYLSIPERYHVRKGDVLISLTGSHITQPNSVVGRVARYALELPQCLLNQRAGKIIVKDRDRCHPDYLFYALSEQDTLHAIAMKAHGAASQANVSPSQVESIEIPLPPFPIQQRIAGILSAYDELIENSQRRIKILESMARALYREWFVHFRFPGYEHHPRVPSPLGEIPQGWAVKKVANAFEISGGGTPSRKVDEFWEGGTIQWYSPSDLTRAATMFVDDSSDHISERGLAQSSARMLPARSVMLTSRATIGAIAINTHSACTNLGFITCIPNDRVPLYYLFHWLTENVPTFQRMASGATFKEISRGVFKTIEFLQPPDVLAGRFEALAAPMAEQSLTLQRQIQNLRRTRDLLLLPRLLSGQIDLSSVDTELGSVPT